MYSENSWKVILVLAAGFATAEPSRALSLVYPHTYKNFMFIPKKRLAPRRQRVLFLDENESQQQYGRGEIDLTLQDSKIKFDDAQDYEFTSPEETQTTLKDELSLAPLATSGNERFYEPMPRFRPFQTYPNHFQGRFSRPYAPNFQNNFDPVRSGYYEPFAPALRNSYYGNSNGWKARSPRVVFPYAPDSVNTVQTNSHAGPGGIDNVVFREQNFGVSDIGTDEQSLQDIGTGNADAFAERDSNASHRVRDPKKEIKVKKKFLEKPMFIQTEGIRPRYKRIDYYNSTIVLPKFKPISDEQMLKISQIMKEFSTKPSTNRNLKGRRGKMINNLDGIEDIAANELQNIPENFQNIPENFQNIPENFQNIPENLEHVPDASRFEMVKDTELKEELNRNDENKCPQGGTCEIFIYCWMVGGLLDGTCGGLLKGCCHRVAKAGTLGVQDSNSIEYTPTEALTYGPVINDESCGIATNKQTAQRRIVGGDDAGFGTFPWQAYIRIGSSRCNMLMSIFELIGWKQCWIERCGGSLISRRHVVTAGHCVARAQPRHVRVTLGDYVINSAAEPLPAYTFGVRTIKVHPLFKFTPQADRFDVAVLTLDRNVHYMPHIAPICLPERGSDFLGQYGWAAGWGALSPGSRLRPRTLQAVDVPVLDNRVCERWHRANGINVVIYPEMLCAGYRGGGKDSCQGDSGGPLMLERTGRWYLIGVVSAGYSCASRGQPGIYHRVAHTVDWISHATTLS